jgi:acetolactate synthase I/II/III large subunit
MPRFRGADAIAHTLARAGVQHLFSLSGNHIMPIYDAALDARLRILHTRHEGAAVHMADAWGRLTGTPGVALLTGGPGHANGIGAAYTALASESPLVMLSGHAPLCELGRGSFQEMRQAEMAAPVFKASWTAQRADRLAEDLARALRIAMAGRPGPVHVSLPVDLLEADVAPGSVPESPAFRAPPRALAPASADALIALIGEARRPLVLVGAVMSNGRAHRVREELSDRLGAPVLCMESPRGLNDPSLGALSSVVARADLVVLLGKEPDFTLRFAEPPALDSGCRFALVDPDAAALDRALEVLGPQRVAFAALADSVAAAEMLIEQSGAAHGSADWRAEVGEAVRFRPEEWRRIDSAPTGPVHPVELGRALQHAIDAAPEAVFVSDGGEIGQWAQACVNAPIRIINGQGGSIGSAIPFAIAAALARPNARVVAATGDGACGFHLLEIDTAVRAGLTPLVVVGNDACWNAEHQIQLRAYGRDRVYATELAPTRYDAAAAALGAHGELVTRAADLPGALERATASGKPALVNVMIERLAAPTVRAPTGPGH